MPRKGVSLLPRKELLTFEEIVRVVKLFSSLGIEKVRITGGEPFVRENVVVLIRKIAVVYGIRDISLTTNGIISARYLEQLWEIGIRRINISLDTLDSEKFAVITKGGDVTKVLDTIFCAIRLGFNPVKINTVITPLLDEGDILDLVKFSMENPVSVRFIEMMPTVKPLTFLESKKDVRRSISCISPEASPLASCSNNCSSNNSSNNNDTDSSTGNNIGDNSEVYGVSHNSLSGVECRRTGFRIYKESGSLPFSIDNILFLIKRLGNYSKVDVLGFGPAVYYKLEGSKGSIGLILNDKYFCKFCNRIRLTPDGLVKLCLFSPSGLDIKSMMRGNLKDDDIRQKLVEFVRRKPKDREDAVSKSEIIDSGSLQEEEKGIGKKVSVKGVFGKGVLDARSIRISRFMNQIGG
ncbi:MAG: radical SAM protein [Actinobacteria bacterium]|nr:radical SAM protein [Actinomycetota bacterium]